MRKLVALFALVLSLFMLPLQAEVPTVFDANQYKSQVTVPTLTDMEPVFPGASRLQAINCMMGITWHESKGGTYLRQVGNTEGGVVEDGGLGANQVEGNTHQSLWNNFFVYRQDRIDYAESLLPPGSVDRMPDGTFVVDDDPLIWDLRYNTFIARIVLYKSSFQWPEDPNDIVALGEIWDAFYNRNDDAGYVHQYVNDYPKEILS
jgi:hypothetical protein